MGVNEAQTPERTEQREGQHLEPLVSGGTGQSGGGSWEPPKALRTGGWAYPRRVNLKLREAREAFPGPQQFRD